MKLSLLYITFKYNFKFYESKDGKYGLYLQASNIPYYLSTPINYDGSFVEWIIVGGTRNKAVQYTLLEFDCERCDSGLTVKFEINNHVSASSILIDDYHNKNYSDCYSLFLS